MANRGRKGNIRLNGWITCLGQLIETAALKISFPTIKVMVALASMTFFVAVNVQAAVPPNGTVISSPAQLTYAGLNNSINTSVDFVIRTLAGGEGEENPTDIILNCQVEPGCEGGLIIENNVGQILGRLTVTDEDQEQGHALSVLDDIRFEIVGDSLKLADGEFINFEEEQSISLTIGAVDDDGNSFQKAIEIEVRDVNEAPFDLIIDRRLIPLDVPGVEIGQLSVSDIDFVDTATYVVVDDERFTIKGDVLFLSEGVAFSEFVDVTVTIVVTDKGGLTTESTLLLIIIGLAPPVSVFIDFMTSVATGQSVDIAAVSCTSANVSNIGLNSATFLQTSYQPGEISGVISVDLTERYAIGDPIIVAVGDEGSNQLIDIAEVVEVTVSVPGGDSEIIQLTESGLDTGFFVGYIFSTAQNSQVNDCILTVSPLSEVTTVYTNPNDQDDVVTSNARIARSGIFFDDETGEPINDLVITLFNVDNGLPAQVQGDGPSFGVYPASFLTGETVRDTAGIIYVAAAGEYRYPSIPDGNYQITLFTNQGWEFSEKSDVELQALDGERTFVLNAASRGAEFHTGQGALPRIDVPLSRVERNAPEAVTPSEIEFLQYSANSRIGTPFDVGETTCVGGQTRQVSELQDISVPVPGVVNLVETDVFKAGQPIFVRVTDKDQNVDPLIREKITIFLNVPASNDKEWLEILETGPDTGVFIGYIQTAEGESIVGSCMLGVVQAESIQTVYTDAFDRTDTSNSRVLVDPFGILFSTKDGRRIDGVTVTLIDKSTGAPAEVFGDGPFFAAYPSTLITGGGATDANGLEYDFPDGGYRFPFVGTGFYRLEISNVPEEFIFPSTVSINQIQNLPGAPYSIREGSYLDDFEVPVGPALHIDVPLDEQEGDLFISKQVSKQFAAIGDFVRYQLSVENNEVSSVRDAQVLDTLPPGFRYQKDSLTINGEKLGNPDIGPDGRTMIIDLPPVETDIINLAYVVEITSGSPIGPAINIARVIGDLVANSNEASARIVVTNELFNDKATLIGKVFLQQCNEEDSETVGLSGVRLFLEDGSFVITDDRGLWHVEGLEPGTHIVQLDVDSLDERYEVSPCNKNSRFAGTPSSQFVDLQGGTLWRADFAVQEKPAPESKIGLKQTLKVDDEGIWVSVAATNHGQVAVSDVKMIYNVPKGWRIVPGSEVLDGKTIAHSKSIIGTVWNLDTIELDRDLRFRIEPVVATAILEASAQENQLVVLRPRFRTRSTELSFQDLIDLDNLVETWATKEWESIMVVGHTDNVPISPRNRHLFADNTVLSKARALAVANYLSSRMTAPITVVGAGDRYPISSNESSFGRQQNRRVEFLLKKAPKKIPERQVVDAKLLNGESIVRLGFKSLGTPKGRTGSNKLPLNQLVSGFEVLSTSVETTALGSWDLVEVAEDSDSVARDPNVQGLINVVDGQRLSRAIMAVRLDLDSRLKPRLTLDGTEVGSDRIGFKLDDDKTGKTIYSYIGVDFGAPGEHKLVLEGLDGFNNPRYTETAIIVRVGELFKIEVVSDEGNIADGLTPVRVKLRLTDKQGEPLSVATRVILESEELRRFDRNFSLSDFSEIADADYIDIDRDGVLKFNPVSHSGLFQATLKFDDREQDIEVFVEAEKRDWIMVGLAEGSLAFKTLSGNLENAADSSIKDERDTEGRIAFYAKGQVKGEYVLTMAYDTAKDVKGSLNQSVDPNSYYTLYGDQSNTQYDAASSEKLFLKIERDQFYAMFGDFNTGLGFTELSNYSRSLTGFKTEYTGEKFELNAFVSETDQAFVKDEIRGDGTSGLYRLSAKEIVINSERIVIETRDRFHTQDIINEVSLTRHIDYNIDYDAGTIFFKSPIFSQDNAFNPIFIVVDFETGGTGGKQLNAGGRIAYKPNKDTEVGVTVIKEGVSRRETALLGMDFNYKISDATEIRAEVAATRSTIGDLDTEGSAYIVEAIHRSANLETIAYVREQEGDFGLGQQNSSEAGTRKIGVEAKYQINENIEAVGEAYREANLGAGTNQDVVSSTVRMLGDKYTVNTGIRTVMSETGSEDQVSNQILLGGSYRMLDDKLTLNVNADAPIGGKGEAANFPKRLSVGLDYKLNNEITLKAEQEFTWGDTEDAQKTRIGLNASLWDGGELITNIEQSFDEGAEQLAAVAGLKQRFELNENWSFDFGIDRSQTMKSEKKAPPALRVTTVFSSPDDNDFTSLTFGSKFQQEAWDWATRLEYRTADSEDKINLVSDVIHNLKDGRQLLAKVNIQRIRSDLNETFSTDIQVGYSYRPEDSRWTLFNRLDLRHASSQSAASDIQTQKIVNNLNANYMWSNRTQIALQYGFKYVIDNFESDEYRGFTDLYGMEVRHDMNSRWDIGFQGSLYNSHNADISDYSYGVSFGYNMTRNVWVSLGYNFSGFTDDDFSASEYTEEGVFLKYRFKFDQYTAKSIMGMMDDS